MISNEVMPPSLDLSGDTMRYSAPELLYEDTDHTKASDTYSFAMLILACITENPPFPDLSRSYEILSARSYKRQNPPRPDGPNNIPDDLWDLMERCWERKPRQRPTMEQVHGFFLNQT